MQDLAATLREGGDNDEGRRSGAPDQPAEPKGPAMKFTYPSGSRPLEGYTIKRGIGAGGFGEVYYATSDAGKEVALKHIQRNLDIELRGVSQCLNLKHPNLVSLFDIKYDESGEGWVVMEYVCGESLSDVIQRNPNGMPRDAVNFWISGVAAGVACLHDHGIVHRDLKPGNLFNDEGIVKIGDYGLSKFISVSRRSGQTESVGTFHYMAPEIGRGCYGKEIDVYALGIILYEMLTGTVPFDGESSQEIIMKHLTADPDLTDVPQPYRSVIAKALVKDSKQRLNSMTSILEQLHVTAPLLHETTAHAPAAVVAEVSPVLEIGPTEDDERTLHLTDGHADMVFGPVETIAEAVPARDGAAGARDRAVRTRDEEPVARAVRDGWHGARGWWHHAGFGTFTRFLLLLVAIFLLATNASWLMPTAIVLVVVYLTYRLIRAMVIATSPPTTEHDAAAHGSLASSQERDRARHRPRHGHRHRRELLRVWLAEKPARERLTELAGSMLMAAFVAGVLCVVMMLVVMMVAPDLKLYGPVYLWGPFYAWLTLVSIAGAWSVLIPAKLWEGRPDTATGSDRGPRGEQVLRRFAMLVIGLLLGWVAFALAQSLMIDWSVLEITQRPAVGESLSHNMFAADGTPRLPAYFVYLAGLFVVLRWWHQADPLRTTRLSFWATVACFLWAWLLQLVLPFPQPWGFMLAITIAIAVQLSAPWMSPQQRSEVREQLADNRR